MKKGFILFVGFFAAAFPSLATSFYSGSDTACFYGLFQSSCTESALVTNTPSKNLSFTPTASFDAPQTGGQIDLGTFAVPRSLFNLNVATFDIDLQFTAPPGAGSEQYSAFTLGLVIFNSLGAEVTFNQPTTQLFTYPGGAFQVSLPSSPITIGAGKTQELYGTITPVPVPEPASFATVGLGAMTAAGIGFRRRKARKAV